MFSEIKHNKKTDLKFSVGRTKKSDKIRYKIRVLKLHVTNCVYSVGPKGMSLNLCYYIFQAFDGF
jgi:hypothetical protein